MATNHDIPDFDSVDELWIDAAENVVENGIHYPSRDGGCTEIIGYAAKLNDPTANFMFNPIRRINPAYAGAEFLWYMSGADTIEMISSYAPQYERFANYIDGPNNPLKAHGAYGARMSRASSAGYTQLAHIIRLLFKKPNTRQAVLSLWDFNWDLPHAEAGDRGDIPCTTAIQFLVRENKLHCVVNMRSNDVWLGLPYDVFCFTCLQMLIAEVLRVDVGEYIHQSGSLHVYDRNLHRVKEAIDPPQFKVGSLEYGPHHVAGEKLSNAVREAVNTEHFIRHNKGAGLDHAESIGPSSILATCLYLVSYKWGGTPERKITSKLLKKYIEWHRETRKKEQ